MKRRYFIGFALILAAIAVFGLFGLRHLDESYVEIERPVEHANTPDSMPLSDRNFTRSNTEFLYVLEEILSREIEIFSIHGMIRNVKDGRIPGAQIELDGPVFTSTVADVNGEYRIADLPPGRYRAEVKHPLYTSLRKLVKVEADQGIDLNLDWITIKGHVRGEGIDIPIEKFDIRWANIKRPKDTGSNPKDFHQTHGDFSLEYSNPKYDAICFIVTGYTPKLVAISDFTRTGNELETEIVLEPEATIIGRVEDEEGNPIAGAGIFFGTTSNHDDLKKSRVHTYTAADGRFHARDSGTDIRILVTDHNDFAPGYAVFDPNDKQPDTVITLTRGASISGTVFCEGEPLAEVNIQLEYLDTESFGKWNVKTDSNGRYRIDGLAAGTVLVDCHVTQNPENPLSLYDAHLRATITVEAGVPLNYDFEVPEATDAVEGSVYYEGKEENVEILLESTDGEFAIRLAPEQTTERSYSFPRVPAGEWRIFYIAFNQKTLTLHTTDIVVHSNEVTVHNVDVSANSGSISGIVYNAQTPFIFLYKDHRDVGSEAFFQDLHMLMTVEEIPVHFHSLSMFEFGNSTKNSSYQFSNLPDGTYTLAGATMVESPIMINGTRAPYIVQHITITNGEAIELDLGF